MAVEAETAWPLPKLRAQGEVGDMRAMPSEATCAAWQQALASRVGRQAAEDYRHESALIVNLKSAMLFAFLIVFVPVAFVLVVCVSLAWLPVHWVIVKFRL